MFYVNVDCKVTLYEVRYFNVDPFVKDTRESLILNVYLAVVENDFLICPSQFRRLCDD